MRDARPEMAESVGVFFLVLFGSGAIAASRAEPSTALLVVALGFGITILVLVYALGHVSGAHFNPAMTLAFAVAGHFPWRRVPRYLAAQLAGGVAGALVARAVLPGPAAVTHLAPQVAWPAGILAETLATFLLAFVIVAVATDERAPRGAAGLAIGLAVTAAIFFAGPLTGASLNPARSLGPALVAGDFRDLPLYLVAPVAGAIAAMRLYEVLRPGAKPGRDEVPAIARARVERRAAEESD
ncbi:MAG: MIP/aquaporin family protein [Thermoplasmatota archaeon]